MQVGQPDTSDASRSIALTSRRPAGSIHLVFNAYWEPLEFELPGTGHRGVGWTRIIDTSLPSPSDIEVDRAARPCRMHLPGHAAVGRRARGADAGLEPRHLGLVADLRHARDHRRDLLDQVAVLEVVDDAPDPNHAAGRLDLERVGQPRRPRVGEERFSYPACSPRRRRGAARVVVRVERLVHRRRAEAGGDRHAVGRIAIRDDGRVTGGTQASPSSAATSGFEVSPLRSSVAVSDSSDSGSVSRSGLTPASSSPS